MTRSARQKAREYAFLVLYRWDLRGDKIGELIKEFLDEKNPTSEKVIGYMRKLLSTTIENITEVDKVIDQNTENWDFDRLGYVERNLLRLGISEMLFLGEVKGIEPLVGYVSLARKYADEKARRFVNGVLASVRERYSLPLQSEEKVKQ